MNVNAKTSAKLADPSVGLAAKVAAVLDDPAINFNDPAAVNDVGKLLSIVQALRQAVVYLAEAAESAGVKHP